MNMVHIIKVYFEDGKSTKQIRRLAVSSEIVGRFDLLAKKIREIFSLSPNQRFDITWKDSENDVIHMSSDEELAQALANAEDGLLRIYVFTSDCQIPNTNKTLHDKNLNECMNSSEIHPGVVCDACEEDIKGYRYKCLQCRNYDLCSSCNASNCHAEHDMIKLVKPSYVRREWVFLGARKLYRSMFGSCPGFAKAFSKEKSTDQQQQSLGEGHLFQTLVNDFLGPAEKTLKGNLDHIRTFVDNIASSIDVKVVGCPGNPSPSSPDKQKKDEPTKKCSGEEPSSEAKPFPTAKEVTVVVNVEPTVKVDSAEVIKSTAETSEESDTSSNATSEISRSDCRSSAVESHFVSESKAGESQPPAPTGLFFEAETSTNADGWTLVHDHEAQENVNCDAMANLPDAKSKKEVAYPDITENLHDNETPQELLNPFAEVENQNEAVVTTQDPEILNALMKMQAMGFTNEGGWLERLLITKNGNINAALDALYPSTRRH